MQDEEFGDEIKVNMKVVTPIDLVLLPAYNVNYAKSVITVLVRVHNYNPKQKTELSSGVGSCSL